MAAAQKSKRKLITIILIAILYLLELLPLVSLAFIESSFWGDFATTSTISSDDIMKKFDADTTDHYRQTLRADQHTLLETNIPRPAPDIVGEGEFYYPSPSTPISSNTAHINNANYYDATRRYKLLKQCYDLRENAQKDCDNNTLRKHAAIDQQYGAIEGSDNAVKMAVQLDISYKNMRAVPLYVPPGEVVTVEVRGLKHNTQITAKLAVNDMMGWAVGGVDGYFQRQDKRLAEGKEPELSGQIKNQNHRLPLLASSFKLKNGTNKIGSPFGGLIHIDIGSQQNQNIDMIFTGAVETPYYQLGVSIPEDFERLKDAPGVYATLDTENGQLVFPAKYIREEQDIERLAKTWHSAFALNTTLTGGSYQANNKVYYDLHVPAGAAVSLGNRTYVCPQDWANNMLNSVKITEFNWGSWGTFHEIGHEHPNAFGQPFGLGGKVEGEVRNNLMGVLVATALLNPNHNRDINNGNNNAEHGEFLHPYTSMRFTNNRNLDRYYPTDPSGAIDSSGTRDYDNYVSGNGDQFFYSLSFYSNILHSFGTDNFYKLYLSYSAVPRYKDSSGKQFTKREDFLLRLADNLGYNFLSYFNNGYFLNITNEEVINRVKHLPEYTPVTSKYQSGINGNSTGGYLTLNAYKVQELDIAKSLMTIGARIEKFEVKDPEYGTIAIRADGKYNYTPPAEVVAMDSFDIAVSLDNGQTHIINCVFKLNYHGANVEYFANVAADNVDDALAEIAELTGEQSISFTAGAKQEKLPRFVKLIDFQYCAPRSGDYRFYIAGDDQAIAYIVGDSTKTEILRLKSYGGYKADNYYEMSLSKGQIVKFNIAHYNRTGDSYVNIGVRLPGNTNIVNMPLKDIYIGDFDISAVEKFEHFTPTYLMSNKSNSTFSKYLNKSDWAVMSAPISVQPNNNQYINNLIDGNPNTPYHTAWQGSNVQHYPHEYVIDMAAARQFNTVQLLMPNSGTQFFVKDYAIYGSNDASAYTLIDQGTMKFKGLTGTVTFGKVDFRYVKIAILSNTNNDKFSIINEINIGSVYTADLFSPAKVITHSDDYRYTNASLMGGGSKNALQFGFLGNSFALLANTNPSLGTAQIIIDGKDFGIIDFASDLVLSNRLVFYTEELDDGYHSIDIKPLNDSVINISSIAYRFGTAVVSSASDNPVIDNAISKAKDNKAMGIWIQVLAISLSIVCVVVTTFVLLFVYNARFRNMIVSAINNAQTKRATKKSDKLKQANNDAIEANYIDDEPPLVYSSNAEIAKPVTKKLNQDTNTDNNSAIKSVPTANSENKNTTKPKTTNRAATTTPKTTTIPKPKNTQKTTTPTPKPKTTPKPTSKPTPKPKTTSATPKPKTTPKTTPKPTPKK